MLPFRVLRDFWVEGVYCSNNAHHLMCQDDRIKLLQRSKGVGKTVDLKTRYSDIGTAADPFKGWKMHTWLMWAETHSIVLLLGI